MTSHDDDNNDIYAKLPYIALPDKSNIGFSGTAFQDPIEAEPDKPEKPPIWDTVGANVRQFSDLYRGIKWLAEGFNPYRDDTVDDGYDPGPLAAQVKPEDQPKIWQTTSKLEGEAMLKNILQEYSDQDIRERSGWFANGVTTLGASLISPTWVIPFTQMVKYAQVTKGAAQGAVQMAREVIPAIVMQNAILTGTKETEGLKEWAQDSLLESFVALGFGGALSAYAAKGMSKNIETAKAVFKAIDDEVGIAVQVNSKGAPTGKLTAYPLESSGGSLSAMKARAQRIQNILDATDPLKGNPYTKKFFAWAQPIIEGITSPWNVVRDLTDSLFPHNLQVADGEIKAIRDPAAYSLKRQWQAKFESLKLIQNEMWLQLNGLDKGPARNLRGTIGAARGKFISEIEANEMVAKSFRRGANTGNALVDQQAKLWKDEFTNALWNEVSKRIPELTKHEFSNIVDYLTRIYNTSLIQQDPKGFLADVTSYMREVRDKIEVLSGPIESLKTDNNGFRAEIAHYKGLISTAEKSQKKELRAKIKKLQESIKNNNQFIRTSEKKIQEDIDAGLIDLDMLDEAPKFTKAQLDTIELLNKPIKDLEKQLKQARIEIKKLGTNKAVKDVVDSKKARDAMKNKRAQARQKARNIKKQIEEAKEQLSRLINDPGFDQTLIREVKGKYGYATKVLRSTENKPSLRYAMSDSEIDIAAKNTKDKILQMNEEQVAGMMFDSLQGGASTNVLKQRTLLWNDARAEKWLINDMNVIMGVYMNQMLKHIQLNDVLKRYGVEFKEGKNGIANLLKREFDEKEAAILAKPGDHKKELLELRKSFDKGVNFLDNSFKVFMGNYADRSSTAYRIANNLKQFASATLLGNLPILALTEFFTPLFKFTFGEYFGDGVSNLVGSYRQMLKSGEVPREAFQDLAIGVNVALGKHIEALSGYGTQYLPKNVMERYVSNLTNMSHSLSMSNYITDFQEVMVAFMSQAKTLRYLEKFKRGETLDKKEIGRLDELRLNPTKEFNIPGMGKMTQADLILEQVNKHGTRLDEGGWVSNWHLWDDYAFDAREAFKASIEKETRSVITKPNPLDVPFAFRDPVTSLMTQFMSWSFAATSNFAIPVLTKPDSQKFIGIIMTMGAAAMIDPLRQLAKGQEVDLSPEALATSAFVNSGFFTWYLDVIQRANSVLDIPLLRPFQGDRFRRKDPWSAIAGPTAGMAADIASLASGLLNFDITKRDAETAMRYSIPMSMNWMFRRPTDAIIDSMGLSEQRQPRG